MFETKGNKRVRNSRVKEEYAMPTLLIIQMYLIADPVSLPVPHITDFIKQKARKKVKNPISIQADSRAELPV